jgi:hypothetical protein
MPGKKKREPAAPTKRHSKPISLYPMTLEEAVEKIARTGPSHPARRAPP